MRHGLYQLARAVGLQVAPPTADAAWVSRWRELVGAYVAGGLSTNAFHDRFFDLWHAAEGRGDRLPRAVETLFYEVEAYCPEPELRTGDEPSEAELKAAAQAALARLASA